GSRIRPMRALRNCNLTTVAPTGTISIFAGCSGGIEPLFAVAFMRNQAGSLMPDVNPDFVKVAKEQGDAGISKTTNFPQEASEADVRAIYELAYDLGCKGVTVYRDGCRPNQVL